MTLPLLYALKQGGEEADAHLKMIREKDFTTANVDALIAFAKARGGIAYAERRMKDYRDRAIETLLRLPESLARQSLAALADYIVEREK